MPISKSKGVLKKRIDNALRKYLDGIKDSTPLENFKEGKTFFAGIAATDSIFNYGSYYSPDARKFSRNALKDMSNGIAVRGTPIYVDHMQYGNEAVGKAFGGEIEKIDGQNVFIAYFWVDNVEEKIVSKLNSGTYREMSVSVGTLAAVCSECGSVVDTVRHTGLCSNEETPHNISGLDKAHIVIQNVTPMYELSVVSRGAVPDTDVAKIAASEKTFGERMSCSEINFDFEKMLLTPEKEDVIMENNEAYKNEDNIKMEDEKTTEVHEKVQEPVVKDLEVKVPLSQYNSLVAQATSIVGANSKIEGLSSDLEATKKLLEEEKAKYSTLESQISELEELKTWKTQMESLTKRLELSETSPKEIADKLVYLVTDTKNSVESPVEEAVQTVHKMSLSSKQASLMQSIFKK